MVRTRLLTFAGTQTFHVENLEVKPYQSIGFAKVRNPYISSNLILVVKNWLFQSMPFNLPPLDRLY